MDQSTLRLYLLHARYELGNRLGTSFQDFFAALASHRWGTDFEARRAQGSLGDGKCDGFHVPDGRVFQCYAPRRMEARELLAKIREDFAGAKAEFGSRMRGWTLVHNDDEGLPKEAHDLIIRLREDNPALSITVTGPEQLLQLVAELEPTSLMILLPAVPAPREIRRVQFAEIDALIKELDDLDVPVDGDCPIIEPSPEKLAHNGFASHVEEALKQGHLGAAQFERYFADTSRADSGNRVAARFKRVYADCRREGLGSDETFYALAEAVGGLAGSKARSATIIGLLAYLFHTCEVFENPPAMVA